MREAVEVICRKCGQVNRRKPPADADYDVCVACGTPYDGGEAQWTHRIDGAVTRFGYFTGMAFFFGALGAMVIGLPSRWLLPTGSTVSEAFAWCGAGLGGVYGIYKAWQAHNRGEMMYHRKARPDNVNKERQT